MRWIYIYDKHKQKRWAGLDNNTQIKGGGHLALSLLLLPPSSSGLPVAWSTPPCTSPETESEMTNDRNLVGMLLEQRTKAILTRTRYIQPCNRCLPSSACSSNLLVELEPWCTAREVWWSSWTDCAAVAESQTGSYAVRDSSGWWGTGGRFVPRTVPSAWRHPCNRWLWWYRDNLISWMTASKKHKS